MTTVIFMPAYEGSEWDDANVEKNWFAHHVSPGEAEQAFFNKPLVVADDPEHSHKEKRYYILGQTDFGRLLFISRKEHSCHIGQRHEPQREKCVRTTMKKIPTFPNEEAERKFWAEHDSTEYIDWSKAKRAGFPHLKPSTETISLRLPKSLLDEVKLLASKRDVPYQSLLKIFLAERVDRELRRMARPKRKL